MIVATFDDVAAGKRDRALSPVDRGQVQLAGQVRKKRHDPKQ